MAPVSGEVVEKEKKLKKRFSLKSPKKKKEEVVVVPEPLTPVSPDSINSSISEINKSDVSLSDPNASPKKGSKLNLTFRKKKKDLDVNGNEVLRVSTQDLANARDKAAELERDLAHTNADLDIAKLKITELDKKVSELESVQQDNLEKLDDRKSEIDSLKREISRYKNIEEQHERMKAEQAKQVETASRNTEIAALNATILNKNSEIETLKARVTDYEASSEVNVTALEEKLEEQAEKEKGSNLSLQANIKTLEEEVEKGKVENELLVSTFNTEFNSEVQRMTDMYNLDLDEKMAELNNLRAELNGQSPEIDELRQSLVQKENDLKTMSARLCATELELLKSKENQNEAEVRVVRLQRRVDDIASTAAEKNVTDLKQIAQLKIMISEKGDIIIAQDQLAMSKENELTERAIALQKLEEAKNKTEEVLSNTQEELSELSNQYLVASSEVQMLIKQISLNGLSMDEIQAAKARSEEDCLKLEEKLKICHAKVEEEERESKSRGEKTNLEFLYLRNDIQIHLIKIEELKTDLSSKSLEYEHVTEELDKHAEQLQTIRSENTDHISLIGQLEQEIKGGIEHCKEKDAQALSSEKEKDDLVVVLEKMQKELQAQLARIETLTKEVERVTTQREEALQKLEQSQQKLSQNMDRIELHDSKINSLDEKQQILVMETDTVKNIGQSLYEIAATTTLVEKQTRELSQLTAKLDASTAAVNDLQDKCELVAEERDELDSRAVQTALKGEQDISELQSQLNKVRTESEESEREKEKTKELISKLEQQVTSLQSEKDKVASEVHSAQWQKQMAMAGGLAGAGVASAVAYLTALYSC